MYENWKQIILSRLWDIMIATGMACGATVLLTGAFVIPVLLLKAAAQTFCSP